jgi:1-phosphofructokinase
MILCVTPNPAIDRVSVVTGFRLGQVHRALDGMISLGGKGVNAARAVQDLGGEAVCMGFLGGKPGQYAAELLRAEGLASEWTWIPGETRTSIVIVDEAAGQATVINEQGPTVTVDDWKRLREDAMRAAENATCVCLCGTLPPGSPIDEYVGFIKALRDLGKSVWVDTSGQFLQTALMVEGIHIKVNHGEAGAVLNKAITSVSIAVEGAEAFRQMGAKSAALTLGSQGAIFVSENGRWQAQPPSVKVVSGVGSGDSFMGALALSLADGRSPGEAIAWGTAAGTANALSIGSARFSREDFDRILAETTVKAV